MSSAANKAQASDSKEKFPVKNPLAMDLSLDSDDDEKPAQPDDMQLNNNKDHANRTDVEGQDICNGQDHYDLSLFPNLQNKPFKIKGDADQVIPERCMDITKVLLCNNCSGVVIGYLYKCVQCPDYNLCSLCEAKGSHCLHYVLRVSGPRPYEEIELVIAIIRKQLAGLVKTKADQQLTRQSSDLANRPPDINNVADSINKKIKVEIQDPLQECEVVVEGNHKKVIQDPLGISVKEELPVPVEENPVNIHIIESPLDQNLLRNDSRHILFMNHGQTLENKIMAPSMSIQGMPEGVVVNTCKNENPVSVTPTQLCRLIDAPADPAPQTLASYTPALHSSLPQSLAPLNPALHTAAPHTPTPHTPASTTPGCNTASAGKDSLTICAVWRRSLKMKGEIESKPQSSARLVIAKRGGIRLGGRGRGRGSVRSHAGRGGAAAWTRGDPVREIYTTDDDVPDNLKAAIEVYERQQATKKVNARSGEDDVICNADVGDAALFGGDVDSLHFDWSPMYSFRGERESFLPQQTGPTAACESAYEAFSQFWDEDILTHIVSETNRYGATLPFADWYETNTHEIMILFSFWMMLGIIQLPNIKACFSENALLTTTCFRRMFSRQRYERLCSALQFNDSTNQRPDSSKLFPIEPILRRINARFQAAYIPRQEICIDESLIMWKGELSIKQYIKTKAAKFGIKCFELCESATGYLWSFDVFTGKESHPDPLLPATLLKSTSTVLRLIHPLTNKGYTLFIDHSLNSLLLARFLKKNKTDVVGTVRQTLPHVPQIVHCTLQDGQLVARHSGDMTVMAFHDRRKIVILSTYHGSEGNQAPETRRLPGLSKPKLLNDYNKGMVGVDLKDSMLQAYLLERKRCSKWYMKLFKHLLNVSILNARICYEASINTRVQHLGFRLQLVQQILERHLSLVPRQRRLTIRTDLLPDDRYTQNRHWPTQNLKRYNDGSTNRRRCALKRCTKSSTFECRICDVGLCVDPCFGLYHKPPDP